MLSFTTVATDSFELFEQFVSFLRWSWSFVLAPISLLRFVFFYGGFLFLVLLIPVVYECYVSEGVVDALIQDI